MRRFIFCVLLLGGCQATNTPPVEQTPPPEVVPEQVMPEVAPVKPSPSKPRFIIDNIMNLAPETIRNILGQAALIRKEKNVRVWLYRNSECRLHLYFYPDDNGDFRLNYVETTAVDISAANPTVSPNACLDSFVIPDQQPSYPDTDTDPQPDR